jgi:hypothetical protein
MGIASGIGGGRPRAATSRAQLAGIYFGIAALLILAAGGLIWWRKRRFFEEIMYNRKEKGEVLDEREDKKLQIKVLRKARDSDLDDLPWQERFER